MDLATIEQHAAEGKSVSCPAEYRQLATGYESIPRSDWAEQRKCSLTGHNALYSARPIKAGEVLYDFGSRTVLDTPNYLTVQVGEGKHIMLNPEWLQYVNHSCDPNVLFDTTIMQLVALKDIQLGTELAFFYPATEWDMDSPFQCQCGTAVCIGRVAGSKHLTQDVFARYRTTGYIKGKKEQASQAQN